MTRTDDRVASPLRETLLVTEDCGDGETLCALADGTLRKTNADVARTLRAHLEKCVVCRYRVNSLFPAICPPPLELTNGSDEMAAHLDLCEGCRSRIARPAAARPWRGRALKLAVAGIASVALVVLFGREVIEHENLKREISQQAVAAAQLRMALAARDEAEAQRRPSGLLAGAAEDGTIALLRRMAHTGQAFKSQVAIGEAFMFAQEFDDAILAFEEAKRIRPQEPEPYKLLAAIHKIRGQHQRSLENLAALIARKNADADTFTFAGWGYASLGRLDRAGKMFDRALRIRPDDGDALFNKALVETKKGNTRKSAELTEKARAILSRDVKEFPGAAITHFKLAKVAAAAGHETEALEHLRRAVARDAEWAFWARYEDVFRDLLSKFPDQARAIEDLAKQFRFQRARKVVEDLS
jgi:tetratricopeptide (TPR) repeat protein